MNETVESENKRDRRIEKRTKQANRKMNEKANRKTNEKLNRKMNEIVGSLRKQSNQETNGSKHRIAKRRKATSDSRRQRVIASRLSFEESRRPCKRRFSIQRQRQKSTVAQDLSTTSRLFVTKRRLNVTINLVTKQTHK